MANLGILGSLLKKRAAVFADKLSHASLIDGARLNTNLFKRYSHNKPYSTGKTFNEMYF